MGLSMPFIRISSAFTQLFKLLFLIGFLLVSMAAKQELILLDRKDVEDLIKAVFLPLTTNVSREEG